MWQKDRISFLRINKVLLYCVVLYCMSSACGCNVSISALPTARFASNAVSVSEWTFLPLRTCSHYRLQRQNCIRAFSAPRWSSWSVCKDRCHSRFPLLIGSGHLAPRDRRWLLFLKKKKKKRTKDGPVYVLFLTPLRKRMNVSVTYEWVQERRQRRSFHDVCNWQLEEN